jgi:acetylornithine/succinyldiaminopimelate/putrescine aminotransferase
MDIPTGLACVHNDYLNTLNQVYNLPADINVAKIIKRVSKEKQNVVYCSSKSKVVEYAMQYAKSLPVLRKDKLKKLVKGIRNVFHKECYLADLIEKGIAYHVG